MALTIPTRGLRPGNPPPPPPELLLGPRAAAEGSEATPANLSFAGAIAARRGSITGRHRSVAAGMVIGMADTRKVTITLPVTTVDTVRRLVEAGQAPSISGFVQHAVGVALDDVAGWGSALSEALANTGGELSAQERAWADGVLDHAQQAGAA